MRCNNPAALTLVLITPFLTELLCSNLPASRFFQPATFFMLLIVYGLPVLTIREISVRWKLGCGGILVLGLAYGIFNEGVCAKTLLLNQMTPVDAFDGYAVGGINFAWAICILVWHALHSTLYPILLVSYFYPSPGNSPWLKDKTLVASTLAFLLVGASCFLLSKTPSASPGYLLLFLTIMAGLALLAPEAPELFRLEDLPRDKPTASPAAKGFVFYLVYMFGLILLAKNKIPTLALLAYAVLTLAGTWRFIRMKRWITMPSLVMFILGDYIAVAGFALLGGIVKSSTEIILVAFAFIVLFFYAIQRLLRQ